MSEEASHDVGLMVVDDEHRSDGGISLKVRNKEIYFESLSSYKN